MRTHWTAARTVVVVLVTILAAGSIPAVAQDSVSTANEERGNLPTPLNIPRDAHNRKNPVPATRESISNGKLLFSSQCAMCHGNTGDGKGDLAGALKIRVPDMRDPAVQKARTDGDLFYILTIGHGDMPGEGEERLSEDTRWNLVNYMRSLPK